jgi:hypothetical protein
MFSIHPVLMRQLWLLVEGTQATLLLTLEDEPLVQRLTRQMQDSSIMDAEARNALNLYLEAKLPLIRDVAQSRLEHSF